MAESPSKYDKIAAVGGAGGTEGGPQEGKDAKGEFKMINEEDLIKKVTKKKIPKKKPPKVHPIA